MFNFEGLNKDFVKEFVGMYFFFVCLFSLGSWNLELMERFYDGRGGL